MKLLVKMMAVFSTLYAVSALMRNARVTWPFAFLGTALVSFLGTAGDRILMPKMGRVTAVLTDMGLIALALCGASKVTADRSQRKVHGPFIAVVSAVLGLFEAFYHEWVYDRERYEEEGGAVR